MKYRSDFVTNSSSSSFIIAVKDITTVLKTEGVTITPTIQRLADNYMGLLTGHIGEGRPARVFTNMTEFGDYVCENWGYETIEEAVKDCKYAKKRLDAAKKAFDAGYAVLELDVDYNDETRSSMLCKLPQRPDKNDFVYLIDSDN